MISAITDNRNYHAFSPERIHDAWDAWQAHLEQYRIRSGYHETGGLWSRWSVTPYLSALPALTGLPTMGREVASILQHRVAGNHQQVASGMSRLGKAAGTGFKSSSGINEGLQQIFMALDRDRRAEIEATFKKAEANQELAKDKYHTSLQDLSNCLHYDSLLCELLSQMLARDLQTSRTLIANIN